MNRLQLRNLRKQLDAQFSETYARAMNGEPVAMSFVSLAKKRVTVANGRRIELN